MFREHRRYKPKWFISKKIEVRNSDIHGVGMFAKDDITTHDDCPIELKRSINVICITKNDYTVTNNRNLRIYMNENDLEAGSL